MRARTAWRLALACLCALGSAACGGGNKMQAGIHAQNYTFYASGVNGGGLTYSMAGVVVVGTTASADGSFAVLGGEQDYNDGHVTTVIDDLLTGGTLVKAADEYATLTLNTTSKIPGVMGTQIFPFLYNNANHALLTEIDGSATSSGSIRIFNLRLRRACLCLYLLAHIPLSRLVLTPLKCRSYTEGCGRWIHSGSTVTGTFGHQRRWSCYPFPGTPIAPARICLYSAR